MMGAARFVRLANLLACAAGLLGSAVILPAVAAAPGSGFRLGMWVVWLVACGVGSIAALASERLPTRTRIIVPLHYFAALGYLLTAGMTGMPGGGVLWWASGALLLATAVPYGWPLGRWVLAPTLIGLLAIAVGWRAMLSPVVPVGPRSPDAIAAVRDKVMATALSQMPVEGPGASLRQAIANQMSATPIPYVTVPAGHRLEGANVRRRAVPDERQVQWAVIQGVPGPGGCTRNGGNPLGVIPGMSVLHYEVEHDPDTCESLFVTIERPPNPNAPSVGVGSSGSGAGMSYMPRGTPLPRPTGTAIAVPAP